MFCHTEVKQKQEKALIYRTDKRTTKNGCGQAMHFVQATLPLLEKALYSIITQSIRRHTQTHIIIHAHFRLMICTCDHRLSVLLMRGAFSLVKLSVQQYFKLTLSKALGRVGGVDLCTCSPHLSPVMAS